MEAVGAAASIVALVEITAKLAKTLKEYYDDARAASGDIQKLYRSVQSLKFLLDAIQTLKRGKERFQNASGPLKQAEEELERILDKLVILPKDQRKRDRVFQSLKWPFEKKEVEKTLVAIERAKSSLNLELGLENL